MSNRQTIIVLGGGIGGVVSAVELRKKLAKEHRIILIDREREHLFQPSLLWVMLGVGNHVSNILIKTSAANRTEAAIYAARQGITADPAVD